MDKRADIIKQMESYSMKNEEKTLFGFHSFDDFIGAFIGVKSIIINVWLAFIFAFTTFVTSYIWDSSEAVYTLISLMLGDWILGVSLSLKASYLLKFKKYSLTSQEISKFNKRKFSSARFPRIFVSILMSLFMLAISWHLAKYNVLYTFLPAFMYGGITGTYLISLVENVAEFGLLSQDLVSTLKEKLNPMNWGKKD